MTGKNCSLPHCYIFSALPSILDMIEPDFIQDFVQEFIETAATFRELFPTGEKALLEAATSLFDK